MKRRKFRKGILRYADTVGPRIRMTFQQALLQKGKIAVVYSTVKDVKNEFRVLIRARRRRASRDQ